MFAALGLLETFSSALFRSISKLCKDCFRCFAFSFPYFIVFIVLWTVSPISDVSVALLEELTL